MGPLRNCLKPE
ncbi:hypothetical protein Nmel_001438 [Mimus melanotis]